MLPVWSMLAEDAQQPGMASDGAASFGSSKALTAVAPLLCLLQSSLFPEDAWAALDVLHTLQRARAQLPRPPSAPDSHATAHSQAGGQAAATVLLAAQRKLSQGRDRAKAPQQGSGALRFQSARSPEARRVRAPGGSSPVRVGVVRRLSGGLGARKRASAGLGGVLGLAPHGRRHRHKRSLSLLDGSELARSLAARRDVPPPAAAALIARMLLRVVHRLAHSSFDTVDAVRQRDGVARSAEAAGGTQTATSGAEEKAQAALQSAVEEVWRFCTARTPFAALTSEVLPAWRRLLQGVQQLQSASDCAICCARGLLNPSALLTACGVRFRPYERSPSTLPVLRCPESGPASIMLLGASSSSMRRTLSAVGT